MDRPVLILLHAPWETPGLVDAALGEVPTLRRTVLGESAPALPKIADLGGLVVMGGPQDADDDERYPGLRAERRLLAEAVAADLPVLGICLGMQLLALALGGKLHRRHGTEIGFARVTRSRDGEDDPALGAFDREATFLHWHSDAVELPPGATLLASTPTTPVQAFRAGSALGTQFHPEADAALLATWLATPSMTDALSPEQIARVRRDGDVHLPRLRDAALAGLGTFATAVKHRRETSAP